MEKIKQREWSYVIMLGISISLFIIGWKLELIHLESPASGTEAEFRDGYRELSDPKWLKEFLHLSDLASDSPAADQPFTEQIAENRIKESVQENDNITTVSENTTTTETDKNSEKERVTGASEPFQADTGYFDDALFIGDSRTVGLMEYGDLGQAEVLADSGMSVYKIRKSSFPLRSGERMNLEELLADRQFGKVYIMLGINELGYDFDQSVNHYREIVELIQTTQPNALIFLEANLHITKEKSDTSPYYNNENIDRFNHAVSEMADGRSIFYLDVNPLFDDGEGALNPEVTTDHTHILGKYYSTWVDWILTQAR